MNEFKPGHKHHDYRFDDTLRHSDTEMSPGISMHVEHLVTEWLGQQKDTNELSKEQVNSLTHKLDVRYFSQYKMPDADQLNVKFKLATEVAYQVERKLGRKLNEQEDSLLVDSFIEFYNEKFKK